MSVTEAREIADEQIAWWRYRGPSTPAGGTHMTARLAWSLLSPDPYPGGGLERVRAFMVGWLLFDAAS